MKPKVAKLVGIPIAVVLRVTPCVWELKPNPHGILKVGDPPVPPRCFVAREVQVPWVEMGRTDIKLPGPPPAPTYFDAMMLRERFMELKSELEFLGFLNQVGRFSPLAEAERRYGWRLKDLNGCQEMFAQLAKRSPDRWHEYAEGLVSPKSNVPLRMLRAVDLSSRHTMQFHWKGVPQRDWLGSRNLAFIEARDVVSAILGTIEIDHLRGAKFGVCARHDCPKFFEITSRHKRKYCSTPCAHLESLRRMRRRQKQGHLSRG